jgi:membrane protein implicated in regulation of membrane protease activity
MTLELHLNAFYLTAMSVLGVIFIIIITDPYYSITSRIILYVFLSIISIMIYWDYHNKKSEIKEIFEN